MAPARWEALRPNGKSSKAAADRWCKAEAVNDAARYATGDVWVICDADLWVESWPTLRDAAGSHEPTAGPSPAATSTASTRPPPPTSSPTTRPAHRLARPTPQIDTSLRNANPYRLFPGGGIFAVTPDAYDQAGGFDPRFVGWGGEGHQPRRSAHHPRRATRPARGQRLAPLAPPGPSRPPSSAALRRKRAPEPLPPARRGRPRSDAPTHHRTGELTMANSAVTLSSGSCPPLRWTATTTRSKSSSSPAPRRRVLHDRDGRLDDPEPRGGDDRRRPGRVVRCFPRCSGRRVSTAARLPVPARSSRSSLSALLWWACSRWARRSD